MSNSQRPILEYLICLFTCSCIAIMLGMAFLFVSSVPGCERQPPRPQLAGVSPGPQNQQTAGPFVSRDNSNPDEQLPFLLDVFTDCGQPPLLSGVRFAGTATIGGENFLRFYTESEKPKGNFAIVGGVVSTRRMPQQEPYSYVKLSRILCLKPSEKQAASEAKKAEDVK